MVFSTRSVLNPLFAFLLAWGVLGCAPAASPGGSEPAIATVHVATDVPDPSATPSCTQAAGSGERSAEAIANCEFAALTQAKTLWTGLADHRPIWSQWADKCDLGLISPCAHAAGGCDSHPFDSHPRSSSELLALAPPVQVLPRNRDHLEKLPDPPLPELSSVLFSPEMCQEAKYLNNAANLKLERKNGMIQGVPDPEVLPSRLTPDSTVIKLVWEIVIPGSDYYDAKIFDAAQRKEYGNSAQLSRLTTWLTQYRIDGNEASSCNGLLKKPAAGTAAPIISINCFYHYPIDMSDPLVQQVLGQNSANIPGQEVPSGTKGFIILVATHIMVFTPTHPLWEWMTYFWTPRPTRDHALWKTPWNHYAMSTMKAPDANNPTRPVRLANPYLEGNIDRQGMNTNCVSCHSLAAYNGFNQPDTRIALASDIVTRVPHYPASEIIAIRRNYFNSSIRTHFLWSIVNNPNLY